MSAKSMPSGSSLSAIGRPGISVNSVSAGCSPASTPGSSESTHASSATAVTSVMPSRRFGKRPAIDTATAPASGSASSASISVWGVEIAISATPAAAPAPPARPSQP